MISNAGAILEECGELERATSVYQAILNMDPKDTRARNNLAALLWREGKQEKARRLWAATPPGARGEVRTVILRNRVRTAHYTFAQTRDLVDFREAESGLQVLLAGNAHDAEALNQLARLYYDRSVLNQPSYVLLAEDAVRRGRRLVPKGPHRAGLDVTAGLLALARGEQTIALEAFGTAIDGEPHHPEAHLHVARLALGHRDFARAELHLQVALEQPRVARHPDAWLMLGVVRRNLRDYTGAQAAYQHAQKVAPKDPRPHFNLGLLFHLRAQDAETSENFNSRASKHFTLFLKLAKGVPELRQAQRIALEHRDELAQSRPGGCFDPSALEEEAAALVEQLQASKAADRERLLGLERAASAYTQAHGSPPAPNEETTH